MSKYDRLSYFFRSLPEAQSETKLTFDELESILETNLPNTARIDRPWWANTRSSIHALRWLNTGWKVDKVDLNSGSVTFIRVKGSNNLLATERNRYDKLHRFFQNVSSQQSQIALTFEQLGALLNGKLPRTAFHDRPWWANTISSPQGAAWVNAGWKVENVFLKARITTFRRKGDNPIRSIPRYVRGLLDGSPHLGRPNPDTLVDWIRLCKRVGWYFEGVVLYERGGLNADLLNENERAEIEEDYAVCKRELNRFKEEIPLNHKGNLND
jgi:hypothetical protein